MRDEVKLKTGKGLNKMLVTLAKLCNIADQKEFDINPFISQLKTEALRICGNEYEFTKEIANKLAIFIQLNCPEREEKLASHTARCQVTLHGYEEKYCSCQKRFQN